MGIRAEDYPDVINYNPSSTAVYSPAGAEYGYYGGGGDQYGGYGGGQYFDQYNPRYKIKFTCSSTQ